MAIKIEYDRICIGNFVLCEDANGVAFDGKACANEFNNQRSPLAGTYAGFAGSGINSFYQGSDTSITIFPFAAGGTSSSNVGEVTQARGHSGGASSQTHGYQMGGTCYHPGIVPSPPLGAHVSTIDKFAFVSSGSATNIGGLGQSLGAGAGWSSDNNGYHTGGLSGTSYRCDIRRVPFSADTPATLVGYFAPQPPPLPAARARHAGVSSASDGYALGGRQPGYQCAIQKFPFASEVASTIAACTTQNPNAADQNLAGMSDICGGFGYAFGFQPSNYGNIHKFPFASDSTNTVSTGVGLNSPPAPYGAWRAGASSSTTAGYIFGGYRVSPTALLSEIGCIPWASDVDATDVGQIITARSAVVGFQT